MTDERNILKLGRAMASFVNTVGGYTNWTPAEVDKLEIDSLENFSNVIKDCRFFYKRDPIAATVLNKMVEIGMTELIFDKGQLSENEFRVFEGLRPQIQDFIEKCALEYLITGFVVPEIKYGPTTKEDLALMGVKKYNTLVTPQDMWLRDPTTIKINTTMVLDKPSYFIVVPEKLVFFIMNKGMYPDGTKDELLWMYLLANYPEFIVMVQSGIREIPYTNNLIIRRKTITESPYPLPYLYPALEALKHKRNLRRMDYATASRAISAILLIRLGDKDFPILEDDEDAFSAIREQMTWRNTSGRDIERIFELFANHTLQMDWVYPPVEVLLNEKKYTEVNQDIFFALGFPKILTTGETERSQSSDPEMAMVSPTKTMEKMQRDMLPIVRSIVYNITKENKFKDTPSARFTKISLFSVKELLEITSSLYGGGNLSRETYDATFGYSFNEEVEKRSKEEKKMMELEVPSFGAQPFSPQPKVPGKNNDETDQEDEETPQNNKQKV